MGVGASRKKKKQASNLGVRAPPKPLTAVSEGEEHAWSSIVVEEDRDEDKKPMLPPKVGVSASNPAPKASQMPTDARQSIEEKEEYPVDGSSRTVSTKSEPAPESLQPEPIPQQEPEIETPQTDEPVPAEPEPVGSKSEYVEPEPEPEPVVETAPPPREPTPDPQQEGGYLVFSTMNDGTLYLHFSTEKVEGALAYFKPNKIVPAFKFRQNHGKVELIRKLLSNKQGYYAGYADYIKAAREFDSDLYLIQPVVRVFFQADTSTVHEGPYEKFFTSRISAVSVIPPMNTCYDGVKSLSPEQFVSTGNKFGKSLRF